MLAEIKKILEEELDIKDKEITEKTKFIEDLGADSLDRIELISLMVEKYNIELKEKEIAHIKTVGDLIKYVEKYKK